MLQALQDAVNNPDMAEPFTVLRNPGKPGAGGWQAGLQLTLQAYGTVGLASNKQLEMIPEADRVSEIRLFHSTAPLYPTSEALGITADILVWQGTKYRVLATIPRPQRGYYGALAARMAGS